MEQQNSLPASNIMGDNNLYSDVCRIIEGSRIYKLQHCVRAAYTFAEDEIMYAVRTQLTWTHIRSLMSIDDKLKREFYMEMTRIEQEPQKI